TLWGDGGPARGVGALARRTPVAVSVRAARSARLPDSIELAAYFVVSEALTNVVKHASASKASVSLELAEHTLRVSVADDGIGGAGLAAGSGLAGLRDRLEALDATLVIQSPVGGGTTRTASIPCPAQS